MPGKGKAVAARSRSTPRERTSAYEAPQRSAPAPPALRSERPPTPTRPSSSRTSLYDIRPSSSGSRPGSSGSARPGSSGSMRSSGSCDADFYDTSSGDQKCICNICTCGQHHCPKRHQPSSAPFDGRTSYGTTFKGHDTSNFPERAAAPKSLYTGIKVPASHFATTHATHFVGHDTNHYLQPHNDNMLKSTRPMREPPRERFDHTTSHRSDYPWHGTDSMAALEGTRSPSPSLLHTSLGSATGTMNLDTSYASHYVGHTGRPSSPARQPSTDYTYGAPRDFGTTNRSHFTGKQNMRCPAQTLPARPASSGSGHVKYRMDLGTGTWA